MLYQERTELLEIAAAFPIQLFNTPAIFLKAYVHFINLHIEGHLMPDIRLLQNDKKFTYKLMGTRQGKGNGRIAILWNS